jgi:hypothetical protein
MVALILCPLDQAVDLEPIQDGDDVAASMPRRRPRPIWLIAPNSSGRRPGAFEQQVDFRQCAHANVCCLPPTSRSTTYTRS